MNILSFGEILFDVFENDYCIGGAPLNLAAHIAAQGGRAAMLSAVGDDDLGKKALSQVKGLGVDTSLVKVLPEKETGKCVITLDEKAVPCYALLDDMAYDYIDCEDNTKLSAFDTFAFGTLALRHTQNQETVKKILKNNSFGTVYSDINLRAPYYSKETVMLCLGNATVLKLSSEEYPAVSNMVFNKTLPYEEGLPAIAQKFPQIGIIIYTLGEKGSCAYNCKTGEFICCDAEECNFVSTVGAGDSFGATFLVQYSKGNDILTCLKNASKVSAFVVSNDGAIPDNIKDFVKENL